MKKKLIQLIEKLTKKAPISLKDFIKKANKSNEQMKVDLFRPCSILD
ncbi:hypothetical protein [Pseudalkalibacillus hwajinpoensis]|nr:hypothetical protein [Pseudalkalibacillus hwajinpoensis]